MRVPTISVNYFGKASKKNLNLREFVSQISVL